MTVTINYKHLRSINPEAARTAVLDYLESNGGNKADCAKAFGITRAVVYDILKRKDSLKDKSKAPKIIANKTNALTEELVIKIKKELGFGPRDICLHLAQHYKINLPYGTIRGILRRRKI